MNPLSIEEVVIGSPAPRAAAASATLQRSRRVASFPDCDARPQGFEQPPVVLVDDIATALFDPIGS
jgi:hypothetical protein